jgi:serine/threonine protein kinase
VWRAHDRSDPEKVVIIKDAWPYVSKASTESLILKRLQGVPGLPDVSAAVTVKSPGYVGCAPYYDTTDRVRPGLAPTGWTRKHRRLVMASVGVKVHHFKGLSELIGVFQDVIDGEKFLFKCLYLVYNFNTAHRRACLRGVLHRDISLNNIMLQGTGPNRRGLLIDFDHALYQFKDDTESGSFKEDDHDIDDNDCPIILKSPESSNVSEMLKGGHILEDIDIAMEQTVSLTYNFIFMS